MIYINIKVLLEDKRADPTNIDLGVIANGLSAPKK
jgi:hypothetical protein